jgi:hypothetical protein
MVIVRLCIGAKALRRSASLRDTAPAAISDRQKGEAAEGVIPVPAADATEG